MISLGVDPVGCCHRRVGSGLRFAATTLLDRGGVGVQSSLPYGAPREVRAEARRLLCDLGAGGDYILAPSYAVLTGVPAENTMALYEVLPGR